MAVAFTQLIILKGTSTGRVIHYPMTVSDVADAYAIGNDGLGQVQIPSDQPYAMVDNIVSVGGTDTTAQDVFANGLQTGLRIVNKANLNTSNYRQFQGAPVVFKGGSLLRFKQAA